MSPRSSNLPVEPPPAGDDGSLWASDAPVETLLTEPTDLRARLAEIAGPPEASGAGLLTYEPYYGLKEKPFSLSTDPRFLYKSGSHAPVFHELLAAIRRREGLVVLTGDIGTGKTTLCRAVLGHLDRKTFTTFVPDPFVSREDLLKMLLVEFGVVSVEDVRRGRLKGASRIELSYPLYEFLKSLGPLEAFAVLVIDEAQNIPLSLLEEIRILGDLEDGRKLLQVVLVGQPEFREHLKEPRMRQVDQRISMRCELRPLTREGITNYVAYRLSTAGGHSDRVSFVPAALDLVFHASAGIPRVINLICDRALERGHRAGAPVIGPDLVAGAISDLQLGPAHTPNHAPPVAVQAPPVASHASHVASEKPKVVDHEPQPTKPAATIPAPLADVPIVPARETIVPQPIVAQPEAPAPVAARGLFGKQAPAEPVIRSSELEALLHLAPTTTKNASALLMRSTEPSEGSELGPKKSRLTEDLRRGHAWRFGMLPTMALAFIGTLTGISLVAYLLWMGPLLKETKNLPAVPPATPRAAATTTSVSAPVATAPSPTAAEPVKSAGGRWAVQVAAFTTVSRTQALVEQLSAAGFPAYEGPTGVGKLGLRLVLVGPYPSTEAAQAARDQIRQMQDLDGALLRDLETGENF